MIWSAVRLACLFSSAICFACGAPPPETRATVATLPNRPSLTRHHPAQDWSTGRAAPPSIVACPKVQATLRRRPTDRSWIARRAFVPELQLLQQDRCWSSGQRNELHSVRVDRTATQDSGLQRRHCAVRLMNSVRHPGLQCRVRRPSEMRALILVTATPHATIAGEAAPARLRRSSSRAIDRPIE
jgi:hypothetical protein